MKKRIKFNLLTVVVVMFSVLLFTSGCEGTETSSNETSTKPTTKQVCDWAGWNSDSIIKEQYEQGYVFTGKTQGFICDNLLNFQLREVND